ncbi:MAG: hypothetical protein Q8L92_17920, partial [Rubrivivax sp.]|nr:hypothetical protein [Rubrivivax sp.]
EHMRFYEWSGASNSAMLPAARRRRHPWHASSAVLALLTSLLIVQGCDRKGPAERAGENVDRAMQGLRNAPGPAQEAGRTLDDARETTGENIEQMGKDLRDP